jgi:hypothetical protein
MHFAHVDFMFAALQPIPMRRAAVFFCGTFMTSHVLKEHGTACGLTLPEKLSGFRLS